MLQLHKDLALQMGMDRKNIVICDNGDAVEIGARSMKDVYKRQARFVAAMTTTP